MTVTTYVWCYFGAKRVIFIEFYRRRTGISDLWMDGLDIKTFGLDEIRCPQFIFMLDNRRYFDGYKRPETTKYYLAFIN